ncbi:MAG: DUF861 domain-containing protein [Alteromonadaceae bacterium]|nr:DUF861 domain-containing protein [Alteromonadaceae bacterium]
MKALINVLLHQGKVKLSPIKFVAWSVIMIIFGSFAGKQMDIDIGQQTLFKPVYAATLAEEVEQIIRLDRDRLSGKNLGEYSPYEPESGDLIARGYDYFYSKDENFGIGVWESKPGKIVYTDLEYDELMFVLQGSMVMTNEQGKVETVSAGEGVVLPKGWSGTLEVSEEGVRKIWVSYMGGKKGQ